MTHGVVPGTNGTGYIETMLGTLSIPGAGYQNWHSLSWNRDANGWWSFNVDGSEVAHNFIQDTQLTAFDTLYVNLGGSQSQIQSLGVEINTVPIPGTILLFTSGLTGLITLRKRFRL